MKIFYICLKKTKDKGWKTMKEKMEVATFAGGCFWCMVKPFDEQPGILQVRSGYTGGWVENPVYEEVKTGTTGHLEAVQIVYDPAIYSYSMLLELYWRQVDPTDDGGQFFDRGDQYRTAVFYHSEEQREEALHSRQKLDEEGPFKQPVVTRILPAGKFYEAEEKHQKFHSKYPDAYRAERVNSGREDFINKNWKGVRHADR